MRHELCRSARLETSLKPDFRVTDVKTQFRFIAATIFCNNFPIFFQLLSSFEAIRFKVFEGDYQFLKLVRLVDQDQISIRFSFI